MQPLLADDQPAALLRKPVLYPAPETEAELADRSIDPLPDNGPDVITGNPAAENVLPGTGLAGRLLQIPENSGLRLGGLWLADTNGLLSGGKEPGKWSWNSALIIGANLDAEKLFAWKGASFGVQFLRFDGQDTNGQASTYFQPAISYIPTPGLNSSFGSAWAATFRFTFLF